LGLELDYAYQKQLLLSKRNGKLLFTLPWMVISERSEATNLDDGRPILS